jgi:hypothetical protein
MAADGSYFTSDRSGRGGFASGFGDFPSSAAPLLRPTTTAVDVFDYSQVSVQPNVMLDVPPGTSKLPGTSFRAPVMPSPGAAEMNENYEYTRAIYSIDGSRIDYGLPTQPGVGQPVFTYRGRDPGLSALCERPRLSGGGTRRNLRKQVCLGLQGVNSILAEQEIQFPPGAPVGYHIAEEANKRFYDWNFEGFNKHFDISDAGCIYTIQSQGAAIMPAYFQRRAIVDVNSDGIPNQHDFTDIGSPDMCLEGTIIGFQLQLCSANDHVTYQSTGNALGPTSFGHIGGHSITGGVRMWRTSQSRQRAFFQLIPVALYCDPDKQQAVLYGVGGTAPFIEAGVVTRAAKYQVDLQNEFATSDQSWVVACTRPQIEVDVRAY